MSEPIEGKCNARLKGERAGQLCTDDPMPGRTRCRLHGGMSLRAADHPNFRHGAASAGASLELFMQPFSDTEQRLIERWRREPEDGMRQTLGEVLVVQRRALRSGAMEIYARLTTAAGTLARALVSLREVPPPERGLPKVVEMYEGKSVEDFERDLELLQRDAAVPGR
jgi:hypothetical protein